MDRRPVRPGLLGVTLLTAAYGVLQLVSAITSPSGSPEEALASIAAPAALALAVLLWERRYLGWVGALVFYALTIVEWAVGMLVAPVEQLPFVVLAALVVGYLLVNRSQFDRTSSSRAATTQ